MFGEAGEMDPIGAIITLPPTLLAEENLLLVNPCVPSLL